MYNRKVSVFIAAFVTSLVTAEKCDVCKSIVTNFKKGVTETSKSNFGGGNTDWEEKSLGKYVFSETRLLEIIEGLCKDGKENVCHHMVEEFEESLENYYFKHFAKNKTTDLQKYLCIERIKVCCSDNTWGPKCTDCTGGTERPCTGRGMCDGAGTRSGTGSCSCDAGYQGDLCGACSDGYFEEVVSNETRSNCTACHESCEDTCTEGGPGGCDDCKTGWQDSETDGCQDIDECQLDTSPCTEAQFCTNTLGSHSCTDCDASCSRCTNSSWCSECNPGYSLEGATCVDQDECTATPTLCSGPKEVCENIPGSYQCGCIDGYHRQDDNCVPRPEPKPAEDQTDEKEDIDTKEVIEGSAPSDDVIDSNHGDFHQEL